MEYIHAFWVGGLICALVQILFDRTKPVSYTHLTLPTKA